MFPTLLHIRKFVVPKRLKLVLVVSLDDSGIKIIA